jgi:methyl-accepting chemotaxis protein
MDLSTAIQKHAEWKTKFRSAMMKHEQLDVATIAKDNCCDLGKWLHGEAKDQYGQLGSHMECVKKHAEFHTEAATVALEINKKDYPKAETMLAVGTSYTTASTAVGNAIMRLKKEIGQ